MSLRPGSDDFAYLWADSPNAPGYIPAEQYQMNSTGMGVFGAVTRIDEGVWDATLIDLAAPGGHVQVSSYAGTPRNWEVVSFGPDGEDQVVRVRCRTLAGDPDDIRWTLHHHRGQGLSDPDQGKAAYLLANKPKAASYIPKAAFRYTSEWTRPTPPIPSGSSTSSGTRSGWTTPWRATPMGGWSRSGRASWATTWSRRRESAGSA